MIHSASSQNRPAWFFFVLKRWNGWTTCVKIVITTGRDYGRHCGSKINTNKTGVDNDRSLWPAYSLTEWGLVHFAWFQLVGSYWRYDPYMWSLRTCPWFRVGLVDRLGIRKQSLGTFEWPTWPSPLRCDFVGVFWLTGGPHAWNSWSPFCPGPGGSKLKPHLLDWEWHAYPVFLEQHDDNNLGW